MSSKEAVNDVLKTKFKPCTLEDLKSELKSITDEEISTGLAELTREGSVYKKTISGCDFYWCSPGDLRKRKNSEDTKENTQELVEIEKDRLRKDIENLKAEISKFEQEELALKQELGIADSQKAMNEHIQRLHDYNDLKDAGQSLLGKLAELEGVTTRDMYERYGLEIGD